jgi:hypothetical protein
MPLNSGSRCSLDEFAAVAAHLLERVLVLFWRACQQQSLQIAKPNASSRWYISEDPSGIHFCGFGAIAALESSVAQPRPLRRDFAAARCDRGKE